MQTVPGLSVACMVVSAVLAFGLPVGAYIVLYKKKMARFGPVLLGAATFVIAALVLEGLVNYFVFSGAGEYLKANPLLFALYGGLAAGLFEESGRFAAFKLTRKKYNTTGDAYSFGVGHGGIEAIYIVGLAMISNIMLASSINQNGIQSIVASVPAASKETVSAALNAMAAMPPTDFLLGGIERIGAMTFHIGASLWVYLAASKRGPFGFYPLAILLHLLLNIPAGLYQAGALNNIWLIEAYNIVFGVLVLWLGIRKIRQVDKDRAVPV